MESLEIKSLVNIKDVEILLIDDKPVKNRPELLKKIALLLEATQKYEKELLEQIKNFHILCRSRDTIHTDFYKIIKLNWPKQVEDEHRAIQNINQENTNINNELYSILKELNYNIFYKLFRALNNKQDPVIYITTDAYYSYELIIGKLPPLDILNPRKPLQYFTSMPINALDRIYQSLEMIITSLRLHINRFYQVDTIAIDNFIKKANNFIDRRQELSTCCATDGNKYNIIGVFSLHHKYIVDVLQEYRKMFLTMIRIYDEILRLTKDYENYIKGVIKFIIDLPTADFADRITELNFLANSITEI